MLSKFERGLKVRVWHHKQHLRKLYPDMSCGHPNCRKVRIPTIPHIWLNNTYLHLHHMFIKILTISQKSQLQRARIPTIIEEFKVRYLSRVSLCIDLIIKFQCIQHMLCFRLSASQKLSASRLQHHL